jgi:ribosomal protein S18 acetylase RimI-like enzyme
LARDKILRDQGLGEILLQDCLRRIVRFALAQDPPVPAFRFILVDAKNDQVAKFYEKFGFMRLSDTKSALVLPLATAIEAFRS